MRIAPALTLAILCGCVGLLFWAGCSEEKPEDVDATAPSVAIRFPLSFDREGAEVRDSTEIVVEATDNADVEQVEIFYHIQGDTTTKRIALLEEPDSTGAYRTLWRTAQIPNGSDCLLRAQATDPVGNVGVSEEVRVLVINLSDIGPPDVALLITPSEGTVLTDFCFDASLTTDDLADPVDLLVRWDFEGDGIWDRDTTEGLNITDIVCHRYSVPDTYSVVLEVYNQYYSIPFDLPGMLPRPRRVIVKPAFGDPRPPEGQELVRVQGGTYPIGALSCAPGDSCDIVDQDETVDDTLMVRLSNDIFIDKYEVTNRLYIDFLNAATDSNFVYYDFVTSEVRKVSNDRLVLRLSDDYTRVKFQFADSTYWADELYYDHPVTGVTWYGAREYAAFYGLRLP
ncbi:MAG: SUMF1/EgtB/PvdO family nonheme iron enzyme, partial [Candidatus Eisenbacteria bacterium]|nr:SUMF1/EgtB/PvdO family nonheme iron enzyme [Candidatus Eisenbacteria bacterium]